MSELKKKKTPGELSTDGRILRNKLETEFIKNGKDFVSYDELCRSVGRTNPDDIKSLLRTAREAINREYGIILDCVIGEGLKKTIDYSGHASCGLKKICRTAKRVTRRVLNALEHDKEISGDEMVKVNARLSMLGGISLFGRRKAQLRFEEKIKSNDGKELPTADTLDFFKKK